jgi:UDP-N-acetylglucosamine--N-acetylmuramyl-(pentapeptide) pyrophosphoryl-undecaprenol N-acetylglucosamine transferase
MQQLTFPVKVTTIPSGKLRRYAHFSWWHYVRHFSIVLHNLYDSLKTVAGFFASIWLIARFRPDIVFAKGGFVCLPVGYAARLLRVPLVIHDSDARPGLTNRLLARFAQAIGTGMPLENYTYNAIITTYVGVPIDPAITPVSDAQKIQYRKEQGLPIDTPLIVTVGGGLGSVVINTATIAAARDIEEAGVSAYFYNVTGVGNYDTACEQSEGTLQYKAVAFVYENMHKVLGAADIVVTRASATTLQELAGLRKAVIAVPAKQLGDQKKNAELFGSYGAVEVLQDDALEKDLPDVLIKLLNDGTRRERLATKLHEFARPHAARDMAQIISKVARR